MPIQNTIKPNYRVYDPLTDTWSIDWIPMYNNTGTHVTWLPLWPNWHPKKEKNHESERHQTTSGRI